MEVLRTPDDRFEDLPGWDFDPRYVEVPADPPGTDRIRVHHVDEGDPAGPIVLLLHGEPSWSYLYRHMIPVLTDAGLAAHAAASAAFSEADARFVGALATDEEEARAVLRGIGRAATVARERLAADATDQTA